MLRFSGRCGFTRGCVAVDFDVDLEIGPPSVHLFDMTATGVLFLNESGIAADLEVQVAVGDPSIISFDADFRLIMNYTGQDQEFKVPPEFIGGGYLTQEFINKLEPSSDGQGKSFIIHAGAPQVDSGKLLPRRNGSGRLQLCGWIFPAGSDLG